MLVSKDLNFCKIQVLRLWMCKPICNLSSVKCTAGKKFIFIIWENVMMDQKWQHLIRELLYPCTPPSSPCPPYPLNSEPRLKHRNYIFKWNRISALICNILYQQEILTFSNINFVEERIISTAFVYRIFFFPQASLLKLLQSHYLYLC